MKKLLAIFLAILMLLSMVACGAKEEAPKAEDAKAEATEEAAEETTEEAAEEVIEEAAEEEIVEATEETPVAEETDFVG